VSRQETFDSICVVLEEYSGSDVETVTEQLLGMLGLMGNDLLDHLDPPEGLRRWLDSHGLSLVTTHETIPPRVWEAIEEDEAEEMPESLDLEDRRGDVSVLQVGDYIEYKTAPAGPRNESLMGSGTVVMMRTGSVIVRRANSMVDLYLQPDDGDQIRVIRPAESET
jgi:hypothetical protein